MSITELTAKVKSAGQNRSHEQRLRLLKDAHILDEKGHFDKKFFHTTKDKASADKS